MRSTINLALSPREETLLVGLMTILVELHLTGLANAMNLDIVSNVLDVALRSTFGDDFDEMADYFISEASQLADEFTNTTLQRESLRDAIGRAVLMHLAVNKDMTLLTVYLN